MTKPRDAVDSTLYRILRRTYVDLLTTRDPMRLSERQKTALLEPWAEHFTQTFEAMRACANQARADAIGTYRTAMHNHAERVDHEMLDQAAEYAIAKSQESDS